MAKRKLQKLMAVLLAGSMTMGVASTAAFAVDYDAANGTVYVETDDTGTKSWQDGEDATYTTENKYDHTKHEDQEINISGSTDEKVLEVDKTVGADMTITLDGVNTAVEGDSAIEANGGTVVIRDSQINGGTEDKAAVEIGGRADVTISGDQTQITGSGTGVSIADQGSLTVESGEVSIIGNQQTVTQGTNDVSGTGVEISDSGSMNIESNASVGIVGSDVTVKGTDADAAVTVTGGGVGVSVKDDAALEIAGKADILGQQLLMPTTDKSSAKVNTDGNKGIYGNGGTIMVKDGAELSVSDYTGTNKTGSVKKVTYEESAKGKYILYNGEYKSKPSTTTMHNGVKCYKILVKGGNPAVFDYIPVEGTPLYTMKTTYVKPTLVNEGEGTGIALDGTAALQVSGDVLATGTVNGVSLKDEASVNVGSGGRLLADSVSKEGGKITNSGLVYVENATEELRKAIDNSGTGLRFVSFEKVPTDNGKYSNVLTVYWDIGKKEDSEELMIPLGQMIDEAMRAYYSVSVKRFSNMVMEPGDHVNFDIVVTNASGNTYTYQADSLVVDMADVVKNAAQNGELKYLGARVANAAIQALYGVTSSKEVTVEQLLSVENTLRTKGYDGKTFESLEEFYLYYINECTGKEYADMKDVTYADFAFAFPAYDKLSIQNSVIYVTPQEYEELMQNLDERYPNREFEIYDCGSYYGYKKIQIKEVGSADMQLMYFYNYCLAYGYGQRVDNGTANHKESPYSTDLSNLLEYSQNDQLMVDSNAYFAGLVNQDLAENGTMTAQIYYLIDGMLTNNSFENFSIAHENYIVLTRVGGSGGTDPNPGTDPEETEITDPDVPKGDLPGEETPAEETLTEDLTDPDVPTTDIPNEDVPLSAVPKTGDVSGLWLALSALSGTGLAGVSILGRKKRDEE